MTNSPDGIHLLGNNINLDSVVNLNVCEDAVSTKFPPAKNITIRNSFFYDCEDKALQFNYGDNIKVLNTTFINCSQPIRIPFNSKFIENNKKDHLFNDIIPIFIIGLPRSGSTLVEAIITSSENNIPSFGESAFINMGCLLYTSPSPRD